MLQLGSPSHWLNTITLGGGGGGGAEGIKAKYTNIE